MELLSDFRKEWKALKAAPFSAIALTLIGATVGLAIGLWYHAKRLSDLEAQVGRYEIALGIKDASKGNLLVLRNAELKAMALRLCAEINTASNSYNEQCRDIAGRRTRGEVTEAQANTALNTAMAQFQRGIRGRLQADVIAINNELRDRLSPGAKRHIPIAIPELATSVWGLVPNDSFGLANIMAIESAAKEIASMIAVLPN
jgi:hypothetical protein